MNLPKYIHLLLLFPVFITACNEPVKKEVQQQADSTANTHNYGSDVDFLKQNNVAAFELVSVDSASRILLAAAWQGRVITSTATGNGGTSFGWLNYKLISSGGKKKQFNPVGGEERFWLGPEGGQYSLYFKGGDSFNIDHWQVPPLVDTVTFESKQLSSSSVVFTKKAHLTNYSGTVFTIDIERRVNLLTKEEVSAKLATPIPEDVKLVGYESINRLTNSGDADWSKDKGLVSVWLLGMFTPSPKTMVIIPFHPVKNAASFITNNYFGEIPSQRLTVKDSVLYFVCDGKYRSKIGLSPLIAKPRAGSFDFEKNVLTILLPQVQKDAPYVNSKWELQKEPYKGDVINSYNDGPLADGTQMGPFFEIESSSPALALKKGQSGEYRQTTCHLTGDYESLRQLALQILGVNLDDIKK